MLRTSDDNPAKCHSWNDKDEQPLDMFRHVRPRKLHSYRKETCRKNYAHDLESNSIGGSPPRPGIEYVCAMWANYDSEDRSKDNLVDVELIIVISSASNLAEQSIYLLLNKEGDRGELFKSVNVGFILGVTELTATTKPPRQIYAKPGEET